MVHLRLVKNNVTCTSSLVKISRKQEKKRLRKERKEEEKRKRREEEESAKFIAQLENIEAKTNINKPLEIQGDKRRIVS